MTGRAMLRSILPLLSSLIFMMSAFPGVLFLSYDSSAQPELKSERVGLVFQTVDLEFKTEVIGGEVVDTKGAVKEIEMTETDTEIKIELSGDIIFDFDKWDIRKEAEPTLKNVAEVINRYGDSKVTVEGLTDSTGSDSYNLKLSEKRADYVKNWLVENGGVNGARITAKGLGEADPVAPNTNTDGSDNPEGRQKNRRVEVMVGK
jgi:outer membrane protein OmpA-like peptidoglycan-associated protein